ncbi:WD40 repeat-like protein [Meredithblackwellia eburnea MCA 4105]
MQASTRRMSGGASGRTSRASEEANSSGGNASAPWSDRGNVDTQDIYTQTQAPTSLTSTSVEVYELAPRPKVTYDKSIQTSDIYPSASTSASIGTSTMYLSSDSTQNEAALNVNGGAGGAGRETHDELRARIIQELEEEKKRLDVEIEEEKRKADLELEEERARGLSQPALSSVLSSPPFLDFLSQSSKIVQRALSDSYDYLRDYTVSSVDDGKESDGARVRLLGTWNEESWGRGRSVTGVEWSPKFPELFVASYNRNPMAVNEPDGIACVWNLHLLDRPEFVFHSQSDVLSVAFTPFHPNLVVGGTYSGQILLWDTRSRHPNPVLKTPLSASGHTHPVYSLSMIGTQNAHNLISASTDGTVCAWTLDMLARPQETLSLIHPAHNKTDEVSVTAIGFQENETTTFWVGTEEGHVYAANRYDRAGAKAGLVQNEVFKAHLGPVTGMHFHPGSGPINFSDLFLTCGVDWTVRLWRSGGTSGSGSSSAKAGGGGGVGVGSGSTTGSAGQKVEISPLLSFEESDDYVYDVKWHPNHPAMFGSVDGAGKFDLWNLNVDTEVPIVSTAVAPSSSRGLNKLAWDRKEGRRAAIGSSDGKVYVYEVSQELVTPREGEWEQLRVTLGSSLAGGLDLAGR